ncbi:MAG: hypothetical protein ACLFTV_07505, partial [Desulfococcaceae bacterium]
RGSVGLAPKGTQGLAGGGQTARHVYVEGNLAYRQQSEENSTIRGAFFESSPVKLLFDLSL